MRVNKHTLNFKMTDDTTHQVQFDVTDGADAFEVWAQAQPPKEDGSEYTVEDYLEYTKGVIIENIEIVSDSIVVDGDSLEDKIKQIVSESGLAITVTETSINDGLYDYDPIPSKMFGGRSALLGNGDLKKIELYDANGNLQTLYVMDYSAFLTPPEVIQPIQPSLFNDTILDPNSIQTNSNEYQIRFSDLVSTTDLYISNLEYFAIGSDGSETEFDNNQYTSLYATFYVGTKGYNIHKKNTTFPLLIGKVNDIHTSFIKYMWQISRSVHGVDKMAGINTKIYFSTKNTNGTYEPFGHINIIAMHPTE